MLNCCCYVVRVLVMFVALTYIFFFTAINTIVDFRKVSSNVVTSSWCLSGRTSTIPSGTAGLSAVMRTSPCRTSWMQSGWETLGLASLLFYFPFILNFLQWLRCAFLYFRRSMELSPQWSSTVWRCSMCLWYRGIQRDLNWRECFIEKLLFSLLRLVIHEFSSKSFHFVEIHCCESAHCWKTAHLNQRLLFFWGVRKCKFDTDFKTAREILLDVDFKFEWQLQPRLPQWSPSLTVGGGFRHPPEETDDEWAVHFLFDLCPFTFPAGYFNHVDWIDSGLHDLMTTSRD